MLDVIVCSLPGSQAKVGGDTGLRQFLVICRQCNASKAEKEGKAEMGKLRQRPKSKERKELAWGKKGKQWEREKGQNTNDGDP